LLSPPLIVRYSLLPHFGHGGRCFVEPTLISLSQFLQAKVPADQGDAAGVDVPALMATTASMTFQRR
jgi:hypothetical protein